MNLALIASVAPGVLASQEVLSMWEAWTYFESTEESTGTHLRVFSASTLRQPLCPSTCFTQLYVFALSPLLCWDNHIWQVGSCALCGVCRSGRCSWMDEPETKHAVLTLRDAFHIIYLRPRSLLKMNRREQQWLQRTSMATMSLWKGAARFPSSYTQTDSASEKLAF